MSKKLQNILDSPIMSPLQKRRRESGYCSSFSASSPAFSMPRTPATPATPMSHSAYSPMGQLHSVASTTYSESEDEDETNMDLAQELMNFKAFVKEPLLHPPPDTSFDEALYESLLEILDHEELRDQEQTSSSQPSQPNLSEINPGLGLDSGEFPWPDISWEVLSQDLQLPSEFTELPDLVLNQTDFSLEPVIDSTSIIVPHDQGSLQPIEPIPASSPQPLPKFCIWDGVEIPVSVLQEVFSLKEQLPLPLPDLELLKILNKAAKRLIKALFTFHELKHQTFSGRSSTTPGDDKKLDPIRLLTIFRLLAHLKNCWKESLAMENSLPTCAADYEKDLQSELSAEEVRHVVEKAFSQFRNQVGRATEQELGDSDMIELPETDESETSSGIEWTDGHFISKREWADVALHVYRDHHKLAGKILFVLLFTEEERQRGTLTGKNGVKLDPFRIEAIFGMDLTPSDIPVKVGDLLQAFTNFRPSLHGDELARFRNIYETFSMGGSRDTRQLRFLVET